MDVSDPKTAKARMILLRLPLFIEKIEIVDYYFHMIFLYELWLANRGPYRKVPDND